jgi:hypothetical protein
VKHEEKQLMGELTEGDGGLHWRDLSFFGCCGIRMLLQKWIEGIGPNPAGDATAYRTISGLFAGMAGWYHRHP